VERIPDVGPAMSSIHVRGCPPAGTSASLFVWALSKYPQAAGRAAEKYAVLGQKLVESVQVGPRDQYLAYVCP
jgi:hypothetical protein